MVAHEWRHHVQDGHFFSRERLPLTSSMKAERPARRRTGRHQRDQIVVDTAGLEEIVVELRRDQRPIVHDLLEVEHAGGRGAGRGEDVPLDVVGQSHRVEIAVVVDVHSRYCRILIVDDELQLPRERAAKNQHGLFSLKLRRDALQQLTTALPVCRGRADLLQVPASRAEQRAGLTAADRASLGFMSA